MIEKVILDYLSTALSVPVRMERDDSLTNYVLIEKTGSGETNYIKRATIAVQSYAGTLYEAAELNEDVKEAMQDITLLANVSRCALNSDYNFTDSAKKVYRYQAVFDLVFI